MSDTSNGYDIPINEVAKILDKSDRQVRRYVKERRLTVKPIRIDGHVKLMFRREEVEDFRDKFTPEGMLAGGQEETVVSDEPSAEPISEASIIDVDTSGDSMAVKYVIDVLREQMGQLRDENRDLHYQLEQRSGQVGFLQGQVEALQTEVKMLAPVPKVEDDAPANISWFRKMFRELVRL